MSSTKSFPAMFLDKSIGFLISTDAISSGSSFEKMIKIISNYLEYWRIAGWSEQVECKSYTRKMVNVIREVNPDFILTHAPNDYMPDHTACSKLVFDASFAATVPNYRTRSKQNAKLVPIYYIDTYAGVDFVPKEYVDISDYIETKLDMVRCHESQLT